ncbi:MAG: hypothetical protein KatS3mg105_0400 [Gemmatales bacterium]|nr:MAG: hypothetical protein KatS3mg105_0400 [Gemmatales bacterium]
MSIVRPSPSLIRFFSESDNKDFPLSGRFFRMAEKFWRSAATRAVERRVERGGPSEVVLVRAETRLGLLRKKPTSLSNLSGSPSTNGVSNERHGVSATSGPSTDGVWNERRGVSATSGPSTDGVWNERRGVSATSGPSTDGVLNERRGVSATSGPSTDGVLNERRGVSATSGPSTDGVLNERRGVSATSGPSTDGVSLGLERHATCSFAARFAQKAGHW